MRKHESAAMPSPFPGMNPYLEQPDAWHDFHQRYITALSDQLTEQVRPNYLVKIEDYVFVHELPEAERHFVGRSDVSVTSARGGLSEEEAVSTLAPAYITLPQNFDVEHHAYLEIRDRRHRQLVAVIEVLSPSNKIPGPDRQQYIGKRRNLLASTAHLIEIDLLRGGPRLPENMPPCDYCILVSRYEDRPQAGIWTILLRERLPAIPVPLRPGDPDAQLDLQEALHTVYDRASYAEYIYEEHPEPPLSPEDRQWAEETLSGGN